MTASGSGRRGDLRRVPLPVVFFAAYALLSTAWILGNPAGAAPDETSHYMKALAVSGGQLVGRPAIFPPSPTDPPQLAWVKRTTRVIDVPGGLSPEGVQCNAGRPTESAACQEDVRPVRGESIGLTQIGTHPPLVYLLPGMAARQAHDPMTAILLARAVNAVQSLGLLAVSVALLWRRGSGGYCLLGLVAAATPMAVFLASTVSSSGTEIAGGICFFSALLRLTRHPGGDRWPWLAVGGSGVVLASSRSLGPLWVILAGVTIVAVHGLGASWSLLRSGGMRARLAVVAVGLAGVIGIAWELLVQPHGEVDAQAVKDLLPVALSELPDLLRHGIGVFGSLDARMPEPAYAAWFVMVVALMVLAALVGTRRERIVLVLLPVGCTLVTIAVSVANRAQTGFEMQGRYTMPIVVAVPLLAGEILFRNRHRLGRLRPEKLLVWMVLPAVTIHVVGWYSNARRSAVGTDGPVLFLTRSEWRPPTGWYPLLAVVTVSAATMVLFAVRSSRDVVWSEQEVQEEWSRPSTA